ncbi:MAG: hypothetical protein ACLUIY_15135 [Dorea longicatena]
MDRKGKQKLKRYFIVYVIFAVFFTVGMYLITKYEENAKATQIALLLAEHPELEGEIVAIWEKSGTVDFIRDRDDQKIERVVQMLEETYGYHSGSGSSDVVIRIIWGIGLLVGVIVCSLFLYLDRRKTGADTVMRNNYSNYMNVCRNSEKENSKHILKKHQNRNNG